VEIAAALARLGRMKQVTATGLLKARQAAVRLADQWAVIRANDSIRARAIDVVARYDLRAADSLQLAAALDWCEDQPQGRVFLSADHKLRQTALALGFDAKTV
jgi:predicted nucleic acid-binding protein